MEAKETKYKEILKHNIILFLSYGISIGFIFMIVTLFVKSALHNISSVFLSITLSLISAILIFNLIHFISKSSTLESFRKASLDDENSKLFLKKMNAFFIMCTIFSILVCLTFLAINQFIFSTAINHAYEKYEFISYEFADKIANCIYEEYQSLFLNKIYSTIIIELSFVTSFLSLIPYQKKLLSKYNKL